MVLGMLHDVYRYGILRQVVWLRNLVLIMERVIIPLNKMGVGLPFNILQLIGLFSYYLSVKKMMIDIIWLGGYIFFLFCMESWITTM